MGISVDPRSDRRVANPSQGEPRKGRKSKAEPDSSGQPQEAPHQFSPPAGLAVSASVTLASMPLCAVLVVPTRRPGRASH